MTRYTARTEWRVDAPVERAWDALLLASAWPAWWPGIRSVDELEPGAESGVGRVLRQRWRSLLPYTTTLELEIRAVERHRRLEARATGDVTGTCRWTFEPRGDATIVGFELDVTPARRWMAVPVPFGHWVFVRNVDALMLAGARGLAGLLGTTVVDRTTAARRGAVATRLTGSPLGTP
ncbi:MAG TPA: SRPBCC family protein [Candidatus Limnocylindrales bacterium]|nr:SRPBCC family protein [Candidatus Limnocylindrales bacterium]